MENRKEFNFSACMDNAKKSMVKIFDDRLEKMTMCLDTFNKTTEHVPKLNENKISNESKKIHKKIKTKFKSRKIPIQSQYDNKALSFKMALARRKFSKYESLKQRSNKTLYYFDGGFKRFKCNKCAKIFKYESNSNRHSCVHSIQSNRSSHFEINSRNHLGKKQYKCDECEKEFFWPSYLIIHKRSHTKDQPSKTPYSCDQCGKEFFWRSHLTFHKRSHPRERPFSCDLCEQKCASLASLKIHKRKHTGERPYSCDKCGKRFAQQSNLTYHSRVHKNQNNNFSPFKNNFKRV